MEEIIEKTINKSKTIGIGSGKTISNLIPYLPKDRIYIPSSYQTNYLLSENNLETSTLETTENLDLYYDSADFYDEDENLLKGGGGCLTTEKIMLGMCNKSAIVVHKNKFVQTFNKERVTCEVLPCAMAYFSKILSQKKIGFSLRKCDGKFGPVISDLGNLIFDVDFSLGIVDDLKMISGVIEHGFVQKKMYNYEIYTIN